MRKKIQTPLKKHPLSRIRLPAETEMVHRLQINLKKWSKMTLKQQPAMLIKQMMMTKTKYENED